MTLGVASMFHRGSYFIRRIMASVYATVAIAVVSPCCSGSILLLSQLRLLLLCCYSTVTVLAVLLEES